MNSNTLRHTLDFELLSSHPARRGGTIVVLCLCGLVFSLTGIVPAWRKLRAV